VTTKTGLGSQVLQTVAALTRGQSAAVLMRHSAREEITDMSRAVHAPLSVHGRDEAARFGSELPNWFSLHLRHSHVERCRHTAEIIGDACRGKGGTVAGIQPDARLGGPYIRDVAAVNALMGRLGSRFVRAWFDGTLGDKIIAPRADAAETQIAVVRQVLGDSPAGSLHLLVTHDWNILAVREELLGLRPEDVGWVDYLDGVVFVREQESLVASCLSLARRFSLRSQVLLTSSTATMPRTA
jgi:hypothetical protein